MCSVNGIKALLFIENLIFWLTGSGLIGLGMYLLMATSLPGILEFLSGATTLCHLAVGAGSFLFISGLLGCCGAAYHNDCLLRSYILMLVLLILAEIGIGIFVGLGFGDGHIRQIWDSTDENSRKVIYTTFKCCGFESPSDDDYCTSDSDLATYDGCYTKLTESLKELDIILLCTGATVALLQILGIIMSCFLACNKKEHFENQVVPLQPRGGYDNAGYR